MYTASAHPVESACRSSLLLAVCRLIVDIKWNIRTASTRDREAEENKVKGVAITSGVLPVKS